MKKHYIISKLQIKPKFIYLILLFFILILGHKLDLMAQCIQTIDETATKSGFVTSALIEGHPAICYYDENTHELKYVRALDLNGTDWPTPSTIEEIGTNTGFPSMKNINGLPAISYISSGQLFYLKAKDIHGYDWNAPILVDLVQTGSLFSGLEIVNGFPAIAYNDLGNWSINYIRATNSNGTSWGTPLEVFAETGAGWHVQMHVLHSTPRISFANISNNKIYYLSSRGINGSNWNYPERICYEEATMHSLGSNQGYPAISYYDELHGDLFYAQADDTAGNDWYYEDLLDVNGDVGIANCLSSMEGYATISYYDVTNQYVKQITAADLQASYWEAPVIIDIAPNQTHVSTLHNNFNNNPSLFYFDDTQGLISTDLSAYSWNNALYFDGIDDYVSTKEVAPLGKDNFTMALWVKWDGENGGVIIYNGDPKKDGIGIILFEGGEIHLYAKYVADFNTGLSLLPDQWTHLALVAWEPGDWRFYINGVDQSISFNNGIIEPTKYLRLGGVGGSPAWEYFKGSVADVNLWTDPLTPYWINQYMNQIIEIDGYFNSHICQFKMNQDNYCGNILYNNRSSLFGEMLGENGPNNLPQFFRAEELVDVQPPLSKHMIDIQVSPNPTSDIISFSGLEQATHYARVLDITGVEHKVETISNSTLDISDLSDGLYFVSLHSTDPAQGVKKIFKVIKN